MSQTIGSLVASVRATSSQFGADMAECGKSVDRLQGRFDSFASSGGLKLGAAIGAGMATFNAAMSAVTGTVHQFFSVISRADDLDDFANQIGATSQELQGLHFAADLMGSSSEAIDAGLAKMVQKLGEARAGSEQTRKAFASLGLDVDKLAGMSAGEAFKSIADAFTKIESPADQAALAVDLFGKQGASLINVLKGGSAEIDQFISRAEELGVVLGEEDKQALLEADNAVKELSAAWNGMWNQLTVLVAPILTTIVNLLTALAQGANIVTQALRAAFGIEATHIDTAKESTVAASSAMAEYNQQLKEAAAAEKAAADEMARFRQQGEQIAKSVRTPLEIFEDTLQDLSKLLNVGAIDWQTYTRAVEKANDELDRASESKQNLDRLKAAPGVGAVQAGTTGYFSAVQAATRQQIAGQKRHEEIAKRQLDEAKEQSRILAAIERATKQATGTRTGADI